MKTILGISFLFSGCISAASADNAKNETFYIDEDGVLECNMSEAKIAWNFYTNLYSTDSVEISYMSRLVDNSGKYAIADEGRNLTVTNVTAGDAGRYMCDSLGDRPERQRFNVVVQRRTTSKAVSMFLLNVMIIALCVVCGTALS